MKNIELKKGHFVRPDQITAIEARLGGQTPTPDQVLVFLEGGSAIRIECDSYEDAVDQARELNAIVTEARRGGLSRWYRKHDELIDLEAVIAVGSVRKDIVTWKFDVVLQGGKTIELQFSEGRANACEACKREIEERILGLKETDDE